VISLKGQEFPDTYAARGSAYLKKRDLPRARRTSTPRSA
jgi:hypothetical protein